MSSDRSLVDPPLAATSDVVLRMAPLETVGPWSTQEPFLFCVHHNDHYPRGDGELRPAASLSGRRLGNDFAGKDGWSMYHGQAVPGFPQHPHRGFETVSIVRKGLIDHADSLGATARFGHGDVQWLTAGGGIQHSEMFPLVNEQDDNPLELFQIWLNLPKVRKMTEPYFSMLWRESIPTVVTKDTEGRAAEVTVVAGRYGLASAPTPPPDSWASDPRNDVGIWTIRLSPNARWTLPSAAESSKRTLYFFSGDELRVGQQEVPAKHRVELRSNVDVPLEAGADGAELLLLQGRPIREPIVQHGPFVMNTREEIRQAVYDYQRTQFGGWPYRDQAPVHPISAGRFAKHADGRLERPTSG